MAEPRILIGRSANTLPWTKKMISTTMEKTVSAIMTEIDRLTRGRPCDDLKTLLVTTDHSLFSHLNARSAISWNQMALTIFERRKKGRTQSVEKATESMG